MSYCSQSDFVCVNLMLNSVLIYPACPPPPLSWSHFYGRQISIAIKLTISHKWMRPHVWVCVCVPTLSPQCSISLFVYCSFLIIIVIINGIWFHDFLLSACASARNTCFDVKVLFVSFLFLNLFLYCTNRLLSDFYSLLLYILKWMH